MEVNYKLISTGKSEEYELLEINDYCCEEIKYSVKEGFIDFGGDAPQLTIEKCSPYPEGACFDYLGIKYCPFCGKKIIYHQAKRVKRIEERVNRQEFRYETKEKDF